MVHQCILVLGGGPTQRLDVTIVTAEASTDFTRSGRKFCLSLHYDESNSFLFVIVTKICQFKARDSEIKLYPLCLGNISKDFTVNNIKKQV